ncbi:universal stress protein family protein [Shimia isoporae]|uniref:Universal stress protein family protein n=1 Tax=Shimia isoporae TaxID=647720 RepID=A0A4R1N0A8_9RHOB|nr:universal stress protein [Shimia isoporae]TCK99296.1 universal stress protein family protein [Shimia isoporae]
MSLKNILVAFNGSEGSLSALRYAAALANDDTHVTVLLAHSGHDVINTRGMWVPDRAREIIAQASSDFLDEIEARFNSVKDDLSLGDRLHFRRETGRVDAIVSETARAFDLVVIGQDLPSEGVDEHVFLHPDRIALVSGRPVLIVPQGHDAKATHSHAVLAWDGGRAAARALSDALDLLEDQGRVTVLSVGETNAPRPSEELMTHLARHGITADREKIPATPGPARALIAYCREKDPCLLVMGAYEHSKFREDFLGGMTARVFKRTPIPVLLSH